MKGSTQNSVVSSQNKSKVSLLATGYWLLATSISLGSLPLHLGETQ
jgi:hypothetical protein